MGSYEGMTVHRAAGAARGVPPSLGGGFAERARVSVEGDKSFELGPWWGVVVCKLQGASR